MGDAPPFLLILARSQLGYAIYERSVDFLPKEEMISSPKRRVKKEDNEGASNTACSLYPNQRDRIIVEQRAFVNTFWRETLRGY